MWLLAAIDSNGKNAVTRGRDSAAFRVQVRQFALISAKYAKLQVGMGLGGLLITLDYAYLS